MKCAHLFHGLSVHLPDADEEKVIFTVDRIINMGMFCNIIHSSYGQYSRCRYDAFSLSDIQNF